MQSAQMTPTFDQPRRAGSNLSDLTSMNLPNTMRGVTAQGGLIVKFFHAQVKLAGVDAGGQFENRLCVAKQPKGDRLTIACRFITEEDAARQFPMEFSHFKEYGETPTNGTPLSELPGISMSQIGLLTINGLRSIEDLVEVSTDQIAQFGLDATRAQKTARIWMERKTSESDVIDAAEIEARFSAQNEALQSQLDGSKAVIAQMEAQIKALQNIQGQGVQVQQAQAPSGQVAAAPAEIMAGEDDGLEYDIKKMPDPFTEGQVDPDPNDLSDEEPDILGNEG